MDRNDIPNFFFPGFNRMVTEWNDTKPTATFQSTYTHNSNSFITVRSGFFSYPSMAPQAPIAHEAAHRPWSFTDVTAPSATQSTLGDTSAFAVVGGSNTGSSESTWKYPARCWYSSALSAEKGVKPSLYVASSFMRLLVELIRAEFNKRWSRALGFTRVL